MENRSDHPELQNSRLSAGEAARRRALAGIKATRRADSPISKSAIRNRRVLQKKLFAFVISNLTSTAKLTATRGQTTLPLVTRMFLDCAAAFPGRIFDLGPGPSTRPETY